MRPALPMGMPVGGAVRKTAFPQGDRMRKLIVVTQMTLDGVMQAPGGP